MLKFAVLSDSQLRNGLAIFSSVMAPITDAGIWVSIPFESLEGPPLPVDLAKFCEQTVPTFMIAGQTYPVSVTMKNTGTTTWLTARNRYALGSQLPDNNTRWGLNRAYLSSDVPPGEKAVISFSVTAPMELDTPVPFRWKMIRENVGAGWFGERNAHVDVVVAKDAQFVSQQVEASMVAGTTMDVTVTMRNISGVVWPKNGPYKLGSQNPDDNNTWGRLRVDMPHDVPSGTEVNLTFQVRAPATVGQHNFQWRMVQEGVRWLGQRTPATVIRVMPAVALGAVFVSQKVPKVMTPGSTHGVSVTMRNVGTTTWTAASKFRLLSQYPNNWAISRVELAHDVPPNAYVTFAFDVRARSTVGTMDFGWQMAQEVSGTVPFGQKTPKVVVIIGVIRWHAAFQANTGMLWAVGVGDSGEGRLGMAPRTSPAIAAMPTGGWSAAFQATGGNLWVVGALNRGSMNLGMRPRTSPSISASPAGGWQTAFQANDGTLWVVGSENPGSMRVAMAPDTSPSISMLTTGGWVAAVQANDGMLTIKGNDPRGALGLGMMAGTSPSIVGLRGTSGGWQAAFQANTGMLWAVGQDNLGSMNLGMAPNTSPSIAALSTGGWVVAFQANDGMLWVVGTDNPGSLGLGMMPGTSPAITATPGGGWQAAFQANDGGLWVIGADGRGPLRLGMAPGTSPSITCEMRL